MLPIKIDTSNYHQKYYSRNSISNNQIDNDNSVVKRNCSTTDTFEHKLHSKKNNSESPKKSQEIIKKIWSKLKSTISLKSDSKAINKNSNLHFLGNEKLNQITNNLNEDEKTQLQNLLKNENIINRRTKNKISNEEICELAKIYTKENSEFIDRLLEETTIDEEDGYSVIRFSPKNIIKLVNIKTPVNSEFIDKLLKETTINKYDEKIPKYNGDEISELAQIYTEKNSKLLNKLFEGININNLYNAKSEFTFDEIFELAQICTNDNNEFLNKLLTDTTFNNYGNKISRFKSFEICELIKIYDKENSDFINMLLDSTLIDNSGKEIPKLKSFEISELAKIHTKENAEFIERLLDKTTINKNNETIPRFDSFEISELVKIYTKENAEFIEKLADKTTINENSEVIPRFDSFEISELVKIYTKENAEFIEKLLDKTTINKNNETIPRFDSFEISELVKIYTKENAEFIERLADKTTVNENNEVIPRFDSFEISELAKIYTKENSNFIENLLNETTINDSGYKVARFLYFEITQLNNVYTKENSEFIEKLLKETTTNKNNETIPRFDSYEISKLTKLQTLENAEFMNMLIDLDSGSNRLQHETIERLVKFCSEPEVLNKATSGLNDASNKEMLNKILNANLSSNAQFEIITRILGINEDNFSKMTLSEKMNKIQAMQEIQLNKAFSNEDKQIIDLDATIVNLQSSIRNVIEISDVSQTSKTKMFQGFFANNNPELEKLLQTTDFTKYQKNGLPLKYSRTEFLSELSEVMKNIPTDKQNEIENKLGVSLITDSQNKITGYNGIINIKKLDSSNENEKQILNLAHKFIYENEVITGDIELDNALNSLIQGMPEFINIIGKKQHLSHSYSLDIHILTVLNEAIKNPMYKDLNNLDKTCLKLACVMHDIAKAENINDTKHDILSSLYARDILRKYTLPKEVKDRIYELIKNHHWLEKYSTGETTPLDNSAKFRRTGDYQIARIMAEADLKGVNGIQKGSFYDKHKNGLDDEKQIQVYNGISEINKTGQMFLTNRIIDKKKLPTQNINGKDYQIIDFTKLPRNFDLSQYGFEPNTTLDNLRLFIHIVGKDEIDGLENVYELSDPSHEGFLCASYISLNDKATYGQNKYGVSLYTENYNIANSNYENQGSGCGKNYQSFANTITEQNGIGYRKLIPYSIKQFLNLTNSEYSELYSQIQKYKYVSQFDNIPDIKIGNKIFTGKEIKSAIRNANELIIKIKGATEYNEANLYSPKVNAVIAKVNSPNEIPQKLLNYAHKHDLPIYIF